MTHRSLRSAASGNGFQNGVTTSLAPGSHHEPRAVRECAEDLEALCGHVALPQKHRDRSAGAPRDVQNEHGVTERPSRHHEEVARADLCKRHRSPLALEEAVFSPSEHLVQIRAKRSMVVREARRGPLDDQLTGAAQCALSGQILRVRQRDARRDPVGDSGGHPGRSAIRRSCARPRRRTVEGPLRPHRCPRRPRCSGRRHRGRRAPRSRRRTSPRARAAAHEANAPKPPFVDDDAREVARRREARIESIGRLRPPRVRRLLRKGRPLAGSRTARSARLASTANKNGSEGSKTLASPMRRESSAPGVHAK